jgi:hypothetical protein
MNVEGSTWAIINNQFLIANLLFEESGFNASQVP